MTPSRRSFLKQTLAAVSAMALSASGCAGADRRDGEMILLNHVGFLPRAGKRFLINLGGDAANGPAHATILDDTTGQPVVRDLLLTSVTPPRFGGHLIGDFSSLNRPGRFRIVAGRLQSAPFEIGGDIYTPAINKAITYFKTQRCGDPHNGYHPGCHLDDGVRGDDGQHLDVTGGWHDACDLRKWVEATIWGMIGLSRVLDTAGEAAINRNEIIDELRWGNRYFRRMQSPDGYVMNYCGGDDGNHFTDNRKATGDDRRIHVEPCDVTAQFLFVTAQAAMARHLQDDDPAYARDCLAAADRCMNWVTTHRTPGAARSLGAWAMALMELHRVRPDETTVEKVSAVLARLIDLQTTDGPLVGYFRRAADTQQPMREIMHGNLALIALADALATWPDAPDESVWQLALKRHVEHLIWMSGHSNYGIIPYGLYLTDPGGGHRAGDHYYRYFMMPDGENKPGDDWWVGINAHLASHGVGLSKAADVLNFPELRRLAQRQLDWIVGANPFNASTVSGVGRNQPTVYVPGAFKPPTPTIPGGVMNGIGGTLDDQPDLAPKSWNTCEYWTPMVAHTMWLMAELQKDENPKA